VTVSSLRGRKSVLGVNMNESPWVRQEPGVVGWRVGKGELCDNGADMVTVIGVSAATSVAPSVGLTEATLKGATGTVVVEVEEVVDEVAPPARSPERDAEAPWSVARPTKPPTTPPATKTRTTVATVASGERLGRAF
jgi:hypothetical protein